MLHVAVCTQVLYSTYGTIFSTIRSHKIYNFLQVVPTIVWHTLCVVCVCVCVYACVCVQMPTIHGREDPGGTLSGHKVLGVCSIRTFAKNMDNPYMTPTIG